MAVIHKIWKSALLLHQSFSWKHDVCGRRTNTFTYCTYVFEWMICKLPLTVWDKRAHMFFFTGLSKHVQALSFYQTVNISVALPTSHNQSACNDWVTASGRPAKPLIHMVLLLVCPMKWFIQDAATVSFEPVLHIVIIIAISFGATLMLQWLLELQ